MDTLETTNLLLAILTVLALLEGLGLVALATAGLIVGRRCGRVIASVESRCVAQAAERVHTILGDGLDVTAGVREDAARLRRLLRWGADRGGRAS